MPNLSASDVKPFVGSRNFEESRDFYVALGWSVKFDTGDLAELELGEFRFYLQDFYQRQWCENSMLHLTVEDAEAWHRHAKAVLGARKYGVARVKAPEMQDYGALVTHIWDPVGVLLHCAQPIDESD